MIKERAKALIVSRATACLNRASELTNENARLIIECGKAGESTFLFKLNELHRTLALSRYEFYKSLILKL